MISDTEQTNTEKNKTKQNQTRKEKTKKRARRKVGDISDWRNKVDANDLKDEIMMICEKKRSE